MANIPLRLIERPAALDDGSMSRVVYPEYGYDLQPGDYWREPGLDRDSREAWAIVLPNLSVWCTTDAVPSGMWDVSGEMPAITVTPSIRVLGVRPWHGYITNGELVACE